MLRYVARRLLQMVPVFFGATLLIYAMVFALPGDPIAALGGQRSLSPEVIDQIKASYHLDKPFIVQYLLYLKGLFTLDLGQSLRGTESVLDVLVRAYPITIKLSLMALAFEAENLTADHVRTARAKGLSGVRVMIVHVLRNSLVPVVTFLGADLGALMGGAIVTEGIFNIKGVGGTLYSAIIRGDGPMVVSFTTVLVLVFIVSNLLVDLLYAALDPRIRYA